MSKNGRAGWHVYRSRRWQALRLQAKRRDDFKCTACPSRGRLEVHHVRSVRDRPDLAYDLANLRTLCPTCHIKIERGHSAPTAKQIAWRNLLRKEAPC
ncbi:HNH endonuclease [Mesorhizobium sp. IMUNJ 23232]|uniref:HNH endonuclease n=1 Tax=Mesorhizobium sp. IMUNJ 23232 TaxID=3376064 RepID=UPI00378C0A2F